MAKLRISAISYLNTAPLMWDFEHGSVGSAFEINYTVPSQCATQLREGTADIGIIPAAAYAVIPDLLVLPGVAIASRREVRSILLVSNVPLENIQTIALDSSSLTSVALTKILFAKWWGEGKTFSAAAPDLEQMLACHDAGLVIGDPALKVNRARYFTYDLAEEWIRLTGKPFVFAFWVVRKNAIAGTSLSAKELAAIFQRSRDHGLLQESIQFIASEWGPKLEMDAANVSEYLTKNIYYHLDAHCLEGLQLFFRYAHECGALPAAPSLNFLNTESADSLVSKIAPK